MPKGLKIKTDQEPNQVEVLAEKIKFQFFKTYNKFPQVYYKLPTGFIQIYYKYNTSIYYKLTTALLHSGLLLKYTNTHTHQTWRGFRKCYHHQ